YLFLYPSGLEITGYGNTIAEYGVLQVTWQRLFKDDPIENLATYSKRFGEQVNLPFRGKVALTQASLNSTSITLRNVSWQDESCYICSFNVYPDGSSRKQTCLSVGPEGEHVEVVFGCSATGKPAPTIEWDISPGASHLDQTETTTASNSDHTFTSSHNVTLQVPADWSGHVDCLLNRGQTGEKQKRIPFSLSAGRPKAKDEGGLYRFGIALVISAVIFIACMAVAAAMLRSRR
uniref:Ig-like domain-containing protein n=1 Tax=Scophthalmus maximus TaxID=52904 RepID=A0A8D3ASU2_SCOMX